MKVAIVTHNLIKGDGQGWVNYQVAKVLAQRGYEVHIYANRIEEELKSLKGIYYHHVPVFIQKPNLIKVIIFSVMASILLKLKRYDVIHLNGFTGLIKHHVNSSHYVHSAYKKIVKKIERGSFYQVLYTYLNSILEKFIYRRAEIIIAVSSKVKKEIVENAGIPEDKIRVIHNGIDLNYWRRVEAKREELYKYGVKEDDFVILFAGDPKTEKKGLRNLLYAVKDIDGVKLLIAGDERRSKFKGLIKELGIEDKAIHIGFIKDLRKLYSSVDCFILPALYDPFPQVIQEACACGCPVILSDKEFVGVAERIKDGENGLIIKNPYSVDEIKEKILLLKENPSLREKIGKNASKIARSTEEMVEEYIEVYKKLVKGFKS